MGKVFPGAFRNWAADASCLVVCGVHRTRYIIRRFFRAKNTRVLNAASVPPYGVRAARCSCLIEWHTLWGTPDCGRERTVVNAFAASAPKAFDVSVLDVVFGMAGAGCSMSVIK